MKAQDRFLCLACLPYTRAFGGAALDCSCVEGLVVYRNSLEREYDYLLYGAKPAIALRPFAAGLTPWEAMFYCFAHPIASSAVVAFSSLAHLGEIESALVGSH